VTIQVVGLGPGDPDLLTVQARRVLEAAPVIWCRTLQHPTLQVLPLPGQLESFDPLYETAERFEDVYEQIVDRLLAMAAMGEVVYAVPGHPLVGEATVRRLRERAAAAAVDVHLVEGLSFIEPVCTALGVDPLAAGLQVVDALDPRLDPALPALVAQVYHRRVAAQLKLALLELYPPHHYVQIVRNAGAPGGAEVESLPLEEIDRRDGRFHHLACLYLPPLPVELNLRTFGGLRAITHRLRAPGGCPWDREQTHASLRPFLLEETYEALAALDEGEPARLAEELGDLLLQVTLHAEIAEEGGEFTYGDMFEHITAKLLRRHPHVFGDAVIRTAEEQWHAWQQIKRAERGEATSILAGVPTALPALAYAQTVQERAMRAGFRWPHLADVLAKLTEEIEELRRAATREEREQEFGDVLFVLVNAAQHLGINAEDALRAASRKFVRRFTALETLARGRGLDLAALSAAELEALWREAKAVADKEARAPGA
jgi:tetrapyrrole methylase family protein/MazG family protein